MSSKTAKIPLYRKPCDEDSIAREMNGDPTNNDTCPKGRDECLRHPINHQRLCRGRHCSIQVRITEVSPPLGVTTGGSSETRNSARRKQCTHLKQETVYGIGNSARWKQVMKIGNSEQCIKIGKQCTVETVYGIWKQCTAETGTASETA
jgi:hypothetical protein